MPVEQCTIDGKSGHRWGKSGKCFTGKDSEARAAEQGRAIKASQARRGETENENFSSRDSHRNSVRSSRTVGTLVSDNLVKPFVGNIRRKPVRSNPLKADPSRTLTLRKMFEREFLRRFNRLKTAIIDLIVEEDAFGLKRENKTLLRLNRSGITLNTRWAFRTDPEKVLAFQEWLKTQVELDIVPAPEPGVIQEGYWAEFSRQGYEKGAGRAFDDVRKPALSSGAGVSDFFEGTRDEFLRQSFAQPVAIEKVQLLAGRVFTDLQNVTSTMGTQMSRILADGLVQGQNPRVIARNMVGPGSPLEAIGKRRATLIARTEIIRAHASGQLDAMERLGVTEVGVMVEWSTAGDDRVCPLCQPLQGVVMKVKEARGLIPRHVQCVTGDSIISCDDALAILKTHFSGEIIEIGTTEGRRLSITPNHILLTEYGFLPARFAYKGLKILAASSGNSDSIKAPDNYANKACIADVYATFFERPPMLTESMPLAPEDFHGDGSFCNSKINVVRPNSELWHEHTLEMLCRKFSVFKFASLKSKLSASSPITQFLESAVRTADSSMGVCREMLSLLLGRLLHAKIHGLTPVAGLDSSILQSFVDSSSATPELLSECFNAHPILKQLNDVSVRELQAIAFWNPVDVLPIGEYASSLFQSTADAIVPNPEMFGKIGGSSSRLIQLDEIASVDVIHVQNLPVYDVQTQSTVYQVNGLITSNCRCAHIPANVGESKTDTTRVQFTNPDTGEKEFKEIPQKRSKTEIDKSFDKSIRKEIPKSSKRTLARQKDLTRWAGADKTIVKKRPKSILDEGAKDETS